MFTIDQVNEIVERYVNGNISIRNKKFDVIRKYRDIEYHLSRFNVLLSSLEQKYFEIRLFKYKKIVDQIYAILISQEINSVESIISLEQKLEKILGWINARHSDIKKANTIYNSLEIMFKNFYENNEIAKKGEVPKRIEDKIKEVNELISSAESQDIPTLRFKILRIKEDVQSTIKKITEIQSIYKTSIFMGDEAKKLKEDIEMLPEDAESMDAPSFLTKVDGIYNKLQELQERRVFTRAPVPVYEIRKIGEGRGDISEYFLKFGDFILDHSSFIKEGDEYAEKDTGEFFYIENFPFSGVFKVEDLIHSMEEPFMDIERKHTDEDDAQKELNIDMNYIMAVEGFFKKSYSTLTIAIALGVVAIGGSAIFSESVVTVMLNSAASLGGLGLHYFYVKKMLKRDLEEDYEVPHFFPFHKVVLIGKAIGEDLNLKDIAVSMIQHFDETILNEKYYEWLENKLDEGR